MKTPKLSCRGGTCCIAVILMVCLPHRNNGYRGVVTTTSSRRRPRPRPLVVLANNSKHKADSSPSVIRSSKNNWSWKDGRTPSSIKMDAGPPPPRMMRQGSRRCSCQEEEQQPTAIQSKARRSLLISMTAILVNCAPPTSTLAQESAPPVLSFDNTKEQLRPATDEQPQIPFPDAASLRQSSTMMIEGLISLDNPRAERRPTASDVLLLTVRRYDEHQPETVIAAARLPVAQITSFPVRFQMTERNAVASANANENNKNPKEVWREAMRSSDLIVQALVCDRDIVLGRGTTAAGGSSSSKEVGDVSALERTCRANSNSSNESKPMEATGLAKLVRLIDPSSRSGGDSETSEVTVIRAPVSLSLR